MKKIILSVFALTLYKEKIRIEVDHSFLKNYVLISYLRPEQWLMMAWRYPFFLESNIPDLNGGLAEINASTCIFLL